MAEGRAGGAAELSRLTTGLQQRFGAEWGTSSQWYHSAFGHRDAAALDAHTAGVTFPRWRWWALPSWPPDLLIMAPRPRRAPPTSGSVAQAQKGQDRHFVRRGWGRGRERREEPRVSGGGP